MKYTYEGKTYNIPDAEIQKSMKMLDLTQDEAIEMWLDDHDITENEEQEELQAVASQVRIDHEAKADKPPRQSKPRTVVNLDEKKQLAADIEDFLKNSGLPFKTLIAEKKFIVAIGKEGFTIDLVHVTKKTLQKAGEIQDFAQENGVKW